MKIRIKCAYAQPIYHAQIPQTPSKIYCYYVHVKTDIVCPKTCLYPYQILLLRSSNEAMIPP